jgi:hypothetical protein
MFELLSRAVFIVDAYNFVFFETTLKEKTANHAFAGVKQKTKNNFAYK